LTGSAPRVSHTVYTSSCYLDRRTGKRWNSRLFARPAFSIKQVAAVGLSAMSHAAT
jgi:hypothetical protein